VNTTSILEGVLPLQIDLFTTRVGLKRAIITPSTSFSYRFIEGDPLEEIVAWLKAYSLRKPIPLNFPLDQEGLTAFQQHGLKQLCSIPWGKVQSYGEIAKKLGNEQFARAVGSICKKNPWPLFVPCHRVIASGNKLGGFAYGLSMKKLLLEFEGLNPNGFIDSR
jgi:methylated-DNA-[protein]-cysteine S-methyltransferase